MIKIEFPADRPDIARALGTALTNIGAVVCDDQGCPAHYATASVAPSTSNDTAQQLAEDLSPANVTTEVAHTNPKPSLFEPSAGAAADADTAGTAPQTTPPEATHADVPSKLDEKGVPFNAAFCGQAAEPFYATGKARGQWKKKKGVDQSDYDAWYADQLSGLDAAVETYQGEDVPVNTAAAFGAKVEPQPVAGPTDAASLMLWISERQAGGELTQDDVNEAYQVTGVSTAALFGDNPAPSVAAVYTFLSAKIA